MEFPDPFVAEKYQIWYQILLGSFFFNPEFWNKKFSTKLTENKIMQVLAHQIYNQF